MKNIRILFLCLGVLVLLTGCTTASNDAARREAALPQTQGGKAITECSQVLKNIWQCYTDAERFSAFGGEAENSIPDEPGDLPINNAAMLHQRFLLTEELSAQITEAEALEQLFSRNVFCAGVFSLKEGTDCVQFSHKLSLSFEEHPWDGGSPQRYLIAEPVTGFLLLAYGQTSVLETFLIRMNQAYPNGRILAYQEIPAKTPPQGLHSANSEAVSISV